jgi:hypothetical protein
VETAGLSMERRKMDLLDCVQCQCHIIQSRVCHTAYAMRSPFASEERVVGWPRVVVGDAAQMASVFLVQWGCTVQKSISLHTRLDGHG